MSTDYRLVRLLFPLRHNFEDFSPLRASPDVITNVTVAAWPADPSAGSAHFNVNGLIGFSGSSRFAFGSSDFCLECWMYPKLLENAYPALMDHNGTWGVNGWSISPNHVSYPGRIVVWVYNYATSNPLLISTSEVRYDQPTHIALVRKGSQWTLFVNGTPEASATFAGLLTQANSAGFRLGNAYTGYIRDVRITVGAFRYDSAFAPPDSLFRPVQGNAIRADDGSGIARVLLRDYLTHEHIYTAHPDGTGNWSAEIPPGEYDISYFATNCQPVVHGPYLFDEV